MLSRRLATAAFDDLLGNMDMSADMTDASQSISGQHGTPGSDSGYGSSTPISNESADSTPLDYRIVGTVHCHHCFADLDPTKLLWYSKEVPDAYRDRFKSLKHVYEKEFCRKIGTSKEPMALPKIKFLTLGETQSSATPWMVIICGGSLVNRVRRFFVTSETRKHFHPHNDQPDEPCVNIAVYDRALKPLNGGH
jgi:hypothetical protein